MHFGPCYLGSKGLQQFYNKPNKEAQQWGKPPGSSGSPKSWKTGRVSFSFLLNLLKTSKILKSNVPKNTLKVLWVTTLISGKKKTKLEIVKKEQFSFAKRNQGKQAFLGIFVLLLGSQYDVHFLVEFKSLKNEKKKKLPYEQALDLRFSYLQK